MKTVISGPHEGNAEDSGGRREARTACVRYRGEWIGRYAAGQNGEIRKVSVCLANDREIALKLRSMIDRLYA